MSQGAAGLAIILCVGGVGIPGAIRAAAAAPELVLAEGTTLPGFQEFLTLLNSGPQAPVTVTYMFADSSPAHTQGLTLPGQSRTTIDVNRAIGAGRDMAIGIDTGGNSNITAERPIYFDACPGSVCMQGSHVGTAVAPATTWYLAEGFTGSGFQDFITVANPNPSPASVAIHYHFVDGGSMSENLTVAGYARQTVDVNQVVGPWRQVSATIAASQPVAVERPWPQSRRHPALAGSRPICAMTCTTVRYLRAMPGCSSRCRSSSTPPLSRSRTPCSQSHGMKVRSTTMSPASCWSHVC